MALPKSTPATEEPKPSTSLKEATRLTPSEREYLRSTRAKQRAVLMKFNFNTEQERKK